MSDTPLVDLCAGFAPLRRSLVSDGMDTALAYIAHALPGSVRYQVERYPAGSDAWTWPVPGRYVVTSARLTTDAGQIVADYATQPLALVDYSDAVDTWLDWAALAPHLHVGPAHRPDAWPWRYDHYYTPGWGFTVPWAVYQTLPRTARYHAQIVSERRMGPDDGLAVGVASWAGPDPLDEAVLLCANTCHIGQVNDSITGVVAAIAVAQRLVIVPLPPRSRRVQWLFCPEMIGSICYLAHHPEVPRRVRAAIFSEMLGTPGPLVLQESRGGRADRLTRMAYAVLRPGPDEAVPFRDPRTALNDELVLNGPGVDIPTVALSRYPYPEYHTSDDTPSILSESALDEAVDVLERLVRLAATDWTPRRTFTGPACLSRFGLWIDWRTDRALNAALERLMLHLEGTASVFDLSEILGLSLEATATLCARFEAAGLVRRVG